MHRLFVALRPPPAIRAALLALADATPGLRWQDEDQLHLTLAFLGEVERGPAEDVAVALGRIGGPHPLVTIAGVGLFGPEGRPHTLWAGVEPAEALISLHQRIRRAALTAGIRIEARAFRPHITIARLGRASGSPAPFVARHAGLALPPFGPDAFYLFESHLTRQGASYEAVARYPLD